MLDAQKSLQENFNEIIGQLKRAVADKKHPFRFLTFCTVSPNIKPEARNVVLRSVTGQNTFVIYTDVRSQKVASLKSNPICSLFFWHPQQKVQVSFTAKTELHSNSKLATHLDEFSARQYNCKQEPGAVINRPADAWEFDNERTVENFCEIHCSLIEVDILKLQKNGHIRMKGSKSTGSWNFNWIAP